jgi:tetratricopeptide (TPR) repeat protein
MADLMRVQDTIVVAIAEALRLRLSGEEKTRLGGFATNDPEAYELFLKARFLLQRDTEEADLEALKLFEQAAAKDPQFIDAHLGIASVWERRAGSYVPASEAEPLAEAARAKVTAIDPTNVAVRVAAVHQRFRTTRDWAAAEREYRTLMYDPKVLRSVQFHPIALFFVAIGKPDEAVSLAERALVADPGNLETRLMLGNFQLHAGHLDNALATFDAIAREVPNDARPLYGAADIYKRRGDFVRAGDVRRKAHELDGDEVGTNAFANVKTESDYVKGEMAVARAYLGYLQQRAKEGFVPPLDFARAHAQLGNREQALAALGRALDEPHIGLALLKVDPSWDSIRADPRFAEIVKKIGIP